MFVSVVSAAIVFPVTIFVILVFRTSNAKSNGNDIAPNDTDDYRDNYNDVEEANRDLDDMSVILGEMNSNNPGQQKLCDRCQLFHFGALCFAINVPLPESIVEM